MCGHSDLLLVLLKPSSAIILCPGRGRKRAGCPQATHKQCGEDKAFITQLHKGSVSALPGYVYLYPRCQFCKLALFLKILCKQESFEYLISSDRVTHGNVHIFLSFLRREQRFCLFISLGVSLLMKKTGSVWDLYRTYSAGFFPISLLHAVLRASLRHKLSHLSLKCAILNLLFNGSDYCDKSYFISETERELQGSEILSYQLLDTCFS